MLDAIIEAEFEVLAVITAPDRPQGRGLNLEASAVKTRASHLGLPVMQPRTLRDEGVQTELRALGADVFVVAAYGLLLPQAVLDTPRFGCVNVHFSLLPKLRGAAPVQWAIIQGMEITGVTIMQMDSGLDTGPIISTAEERVSADDTSGTLGARLAVLGAALCVSSLRAMDAGTVTSIQQDDSQASHAPKLSSSDAHIDWSMTALQVRDRVRAFDPRPGAWSVLNGKRVKIWQVRVDDQALGAPGSIAVESGRLLAHCRGGAVEVLELQPAGRSRMAAAEFLRGYRPRTGDTLT